MNQDLTRGGITGTMLLFALPMIAGNLLQQAYNVADTLIVGQFLGADALAAVGSAYTLMTFLTSILLGLCMGSGVLFSICWGQGDTARLRSCTAVSFMMIGAAAVVLNLAVFAALDGILKFLQAPSAVYDLMRVYLWTVFWGIGATFLYNFCASLLRAVGNSAVPLLFLAVSAVGNIGLDLFFVLELHWGVRGAAAATVLSQWLSGIGILAYTLLRFRNVCPSREEFRWHSANAREILRLSSLTCLQQSVMNLGILMIQGLVNSFGPAVMAAFAAAVKIDAFAYMPVQDFGNAFSTFIAQNFGARKYDRIACGMRSAAICAMAFSAAVSAAVWLFARPLLRLFVQASETEILAIGVRYLRIEGAFYWAIGILFLLYGLYRAVGRPGMSVMLTVASLGTRVVLAYALSAIPAVGVTGIWLSRSAGCLRMRQGFCITEGMRRTFCSGRFKAGLGGRAEIRLPPFMPAGGAWNRMFGNSLCTGMGLYGIMSADR